jgi:polyferredoxin
VTYVAEPVEFPSYHRYTMKRTVRETEGLSPERRRRILQVIFVFINLALVEAHLPGPLWLALGATFWVALIGISIAGSNLVCGTMCWIGAIQDFFEPFARPRYRLDPRFGRAFTLLLLFAWMPVGWLMMPTLAAHEHMPLAMSLAWSPHVFQVGLAATVAVSVVFLGKRGLCRYFCPFNSIVASARHFLLRLRAPRTGATLIGSSPCAGTCSGCNHLQTIPVTAYERLKIT